MNLVTKKADMHLSYSCFSCFLFPVIEAEGDKTGPGSGPLAFGLDLLGPSTTSSRNPTLSKQRSLQSTSNANCTLSHPPLVDHPSPGDFQSFHVVMVALWILSAGWIRVWIWQVSPHCSFCNPLPLTALCPPFPPKSLRECPLVSPGALLSLVRKGLGGTVGGLVGVKLQEEEALIVS